MKIDIETKFNISDFVYIPEQYHDEWFAPNHAYEICAINVMVDDGVCVYYSILYGDMVCERTDRYLFASYEECRQWCKKANSN